MHWHSDFNFLLQSLILYLLKEWLSLSLGRIPERRTFSRGCFFSSCKPVKNIASAISVGLSLSKLLVTDITTAYSTCNGMSSWLHRQMTCCVWSPPIPKLITLYGFKLFKQFWYNLFAIESPTINRLLLFAFLIHKLCVLYDSDHPIL